MPRQFAAVVICAISEATATYRRETGRWARIARQNAPHFNGRLGVVAVRLAEKSTGDAMNNRLLLVLGALCLTVAAHAQSGNYSANEYDPNSTSNPYGAGSPYGANSINNQYGRYGSKYSNESVNNPYATQAPKLYDSQGNYHGRLSSNPYDPDSTSNPYGRYGSKYSPDSINNPYGADSRYKQDSPSNPYGRGMQIQGADDE
jgi:hypothetical protein